VTVQNVQKSVGIPSDDFGVKKKSRAVDAWFLKNRQFFLISPQVDVSNSQTS